MRGLPRRSSIALAFVVLSALASSAQQRPSSRPDVVRDLQEAERLLNDQKSADARTAFETLAGAAHDLGLEAEEAQARCGLGQALVEQSRYVEAEAALKQCLDISERLHSNFGIARATTALSRTADLAGRPAEAELFARRAVAAYDAVPDPHGSAVARLQLISVTHPSLEEEQAIIDQVIAAARLDNNRTLEADALHSLGDRLFTEGHFEEAFQSLTRARELDHEAGQFAGEGTVFNSLGRVYRAHGRLDEALKCQLQALALHEKYGSPFELMQSHNAVAVVHNSMGDVAEARDHYERALAIAKQSGSPRIQDFLNANIASLQIDQGQYEEGARTLETIIAHGLDTNLSIRYENLSFAYAKLNRPADALTAAERAMATCSNNQLNCLHALEMRAMAYGTAGDDTAARADVRKALDTIEEIRGRLVPADFLKQNFHEAQQEIYSTGIAIAFNHHDDRESLETAELASSRAFLDLLAGRGSATEPGPAPATPTLRAVAPRDIVSTTTAVPANASGLVAIANRLHSTAVVYWPADDAVFMWVVRDDGRITSRKADISRARLAQLIRAVSIVEESHEETRMAARTVATRGAAQLSAADPADRHAWRQLYDVLIAPIRDQLPRMPGALLTIIPHGVLMNVSFAALQDHAGRYLLEDYAIHYAPAGAVLQFTANMRRADARAGRALLVADPLTARRSPLDPLLPPLPGARQEVARIAAFLPRARVTLFEGREATEPRVTDAAAGKTILHFATHAIVRDDAPNDSYLAFGAGGASATGLLTARDVYDLRLNADLVVLSACRSGGGRVTGDGIAAFARAFIYAGTPSLIVSLWDVADEPTSRLLPAFYRTWLAGGSKARSLRRAQLQLLSDLRAGHVRVVTKAGPVVLPEHPVFWAGFVLIGEPD